MRNGPVDQKNSRQLSERRGLSVFGTGFEISPVSVKLVSHEMCRRRRGKKGWPISRTLSLSLSLSLFLANGKLKRGKILGQGERRRTTGPSVRRGDGDGDVGVRERQDNVNHERPRPPQHSSKAAQMYNIHM